MQSTYTVSQMAERLRKSVKTLQKWDREGVIIARRTPTNRRFYTHAQLLEYFGASATPELKTTVAYCRVSSQAQKPDLRNQRKALEDFCTLKGYSNVEYVEEVGGGMNFKRKKFRELISNVHAGSVDRILLAHKDRLVRFGFEHLQWECECAGCAIELLNNEQLSPETEMVQDLMTIVHCFSSRLYGLRNYRKSLQSALSK
jgi:predicted site-specific integrase-resolvase